MLGKSISQNDNKQNKKENIFIIKKKEAQKDKNQSKKKKIKIKEQ